VSRLRVGRLCVPHAMDNGRGTARQAPRSGTTATNTFTIFPGRFQVDRTRRCRPGAGSDRPRAVEVHAAHAVVGAPVARNPQAGEAQAGRGGLSPAISGC
jgi:hypothetical protein